ncbi:PIG-L family deacetylase [Actinomadura roseirufa]|uniref:PIG-L family deacetylase n=1 Tax=Actinomadura roseirufa TaxID=2094049 RepID=UPI0013F15A16|nr:PIG-L family deacetylase [Actinomadura roseirufa]
MPHAPGAGAGPRRVVFSPHLDDAALSASIRLMEPDTQVVTVFAGPPPEDVGLTAYDRLTGARSSASRFAARLAEDERAMAAMSCRVRRLSELDEQYRRAPLDQERLAAALGPYVDGAAEIWAPAGIGGHVDHVATRDAVIAAIRGRNISPELFLYADIPYSLRFGWPSWVTGRPDSAYLDLGFWFDQELSACGLDPESLEAGVFPLDTEMRRSKERAALAYESQLPSLRLGPGNPLRWDAFLRYEVAWRLPLGTLR